MKRSKSKIKIGVSFDYCPERGYVFKPDVRAAIRSQNAEVIPLFYDTSNLEEVLKNLDGVLIPGGVGDLDPQLYGQKKKYENVCVIAERSEFEFHLVEAALKLNKPLLGICWGFQLLNVFFGGTLYQDLQQDRPSPIIHEKKGSKELPVHQVIFKEGSLALELFGEASLVVNSTHHQGVDRLGRDLSAEGHSEDELTECFRMMGENFVWGVQWHPERLKRDPVIPAFLKVCRR